MNTFVFINLNFEAIVLLDRFVKLIVHTNRVKELGSENSGANVDSK